MTGEELAAIRERDAQTRMLVHGDELPVVVGYGSPAQCALDRRVLLALVDSIDDGWHRATASNNQQARLLMDAICSDPAFPPDDAPLGFGERALLVIERLRVQVAELQDEADGW